METTIHTRRSFSIIPDRLVEARFNMALSQEELAAKIGASDRAVRSWEAGAHVPTPRFVRELADKLHVTVPWLRGLNELTEVPHAGQHDARLR
jgi:ribosome-binding protein aMBF1 (putative translation factor)